MGTHGGGSGLTVGTGHTEAFVGLGQGAQHLGPFLNLKTVLPEIAEFLMGLRNGGGVDDETGLLLLAGMGYLIDILFIMDEHPLFLQPAGQFGRGLVVAGHDEAFLDEVAGDGTHADTTGSYKIDCFYFFYIHGSNGFSGRGR